MSKFVMFLDSQTDPKKMYDSIAKKSKIKPKSLVPVGWKDSQSAMAFYRKYPAECSAVILIEPTPQLLGSSNKKSMSVGDPHDPVILHEKLRELQGSIVLRK